MSGRTRSARRPQSPSASFTADDAPSPNEGYTLSGRVYEGALVGTRGARLSHRARAMRDNPSPLLGRRFKRGYLGLRSQSNPTARGGSPPPASLRLSPRRYSTRALVRHSSTRAQPSR
jgi:hypothetical protein